MDGQSPIRNVSDTALWVATWRAMESERPDALFHVPYARRLGGARGEAIAARMGGKRDNWPIVVRTVVMDEIVARSVREGVRTVLNLAAGLDTRPYRMDLPADLAWLHVDMPAMVDYYRTHMAGETPRCALELVAADLRDPTLRRQLFERVAALPGPLLVITEGLLLYLESDQVAALSRARGPATCQPRHRAAGGRSRFVVQRRCGRLAFGGCWRMLLVAPRRG